MLEMLQFIQPTTTTSRNTVEFVIVLLVEIHFKREEKGFIIFRKFPLVLPHNVLG